MVFLNIEVNRYDTSGNAEFFLTGTYTESRKCLNTYLYKTLMFILGVMIVSTNRLWIFMKTYTFKLRKENT